MEQLFNYIIGMRIINSGAIEVRDGCIFVNFEWYCNFAETEPKWYKWYDEVLRHLHYATRSNRLVCIGFPEDGFIWNDECGTFVKIED